MVHFQRFTSTLSSMLALEQNILFRELHVLTIDNNFLDYRKKFEYRSQFAAFWQTTLCVKVVWLILSLN